ncbi:MAG TPA: YlbF family regulator [Anaerolineales bacterium]
MGNDLKEELETAPAIVAKQPAHDFAAVLAESQQFKNYEESTLRFRQDEAAQKDMQAYREKQQSLRPLMKINAVNTTDQAELERLYNAWIAHSSVLEYLEAQSVLTALCQSLGDMLSEMLGMDFSTASAVSCCS